MPPPPSAASPCCLYRAFIASPFVLWRSLPALPVSHAVEHAPPLPSGLCTCVRTTSGKPESILIVGTTHRGGDPLCVRSACIVGRHKRRAYVRFRECTCVTTQRSSPTSGRKASRRQEYEKAPPFDPATFGTPSAARLVEARVWKLIETFGGPEPIQPHFMKHSQFRKNRAPIVLWRYNRYCVLIGPW